MKKSIVARGILRCALLMFFLSVFWGCQKEGEPQVIDTPYVYKYTSGISEFKIEFVKIQKAGNERSYPIPGSDYYTYYYQRLGDNNTFRVSPAIDLKVKNDDVINKILDKYKGVILPDVKKIYACYVLQCNVKNSDELLQIVTEICQEEDVTDCESDNYWNFELFKIE